MQNEFGSDQKIVYERKDLIIVQLITHTYTTDQYRESDYKTLF